MLVVSQHVSLRCAASSSRIHGGIHVHYCDGLTGCVLPGVRFLPSLHQAPGQRESLRRGRAVTVLLVIASALVAALLQSVGEGWKTLETGAGTGALPAALVLVADQCLSEISAMTRRFQPRLRFTAFHPSGSASIPPCAPCSPA
jgi:hypothetical protein